MSTIETTTTTTTTEQLQLLTTTTTSNTETPTTTETPGTNTNELQIPPDVLPESPITNINTSVAMSLPFVKSINTNACAPTIEPTREETDTNYIQACNDLTKDAPPDSIGGGEGSGVVPSPPQNDGSTHVKTWLDVDIKIDQVQIGLAMAIHNGIEMLKTFAKNPRVMFDGIPTAMIFLAPIRKKPSAFLYIDVSKSISRTKSVNLVLEFIENLRKQVGHKEEKFSVKTGQKKYMKTECVVEKIPVVETETQERDQTVDPITTTTTTATEPEQKRSKKYIPRVSVTRFSQIVLMTTKTNTDIVPDDSSITVKSIIDKLSENSLNFSRGMVCQTMNDLEKKIQPNEKLVISSLCSMMTLRLKDIGTQKKGSIEEMSPKIDFSYSFEITHDCVVSK
jgi:hypothetical protein